MSGWDFLMIFAWTGGGLVVLMIAFLVVLRMLYGPPTDLPPEERGDEEPREYCMSYQPPSGRE